MANYLYQYRLKEGKSIEEAARYVIRYLQNEGMQVQNFEQDGSIIVQARTKNSGLKKLAGMDRALTVKFMLEGDVMVVEMGQSKWADKAVGYMVAWFVFWPAAVTATIGINKQKELFEEVKRVIEQYAETFTIVVG